MPEPPHIPQRRAILPEIHQDLQIQRITQLPGDYNQVNKEFEARNEAILRSLRRLTEQQPVKNVEPIAPPLLSADTSQFVPCGNKQ